MSGDEMMTVARQGSIALVTLTRPAKRNALNDALIAALDRFFSVRSRGCARHRYQWRKGGISRRASTSASRCIVPRSR